MGDLIFQRKTTFHPDISYVPLSFAIQILGSGMDFMCTVDADGKRISLGLMAQLPRLQTLWRMKAETSTAGVKGYIERPDFLESRLLTSFVMGNGERLLAGSILVPLPEPHVELFILHVTAERVDF